MGQSWLCPMLCQQKECFIRRITLHFIALLWLYMCQFHLHEGHRVWRWCHPSLVWRLAAWVSQLSQKLYHKKNTIRFNLDSIEQAANNQADIDRIDSGLQIFIRNPSLLDYLRHEFGGSLPVTARASQMLYSSECSLKLSNLPPFLPNTGLTIETSAYRRSV